MNKATGSLLTDLFGDKNISLKVNQFNNYLKNNNQIPFLHFDGENDYENSLYVSRKNNGRSTFSEIYEELGYKLNRGPMFYLSDCVINYSFETFILFVQDGWILEDPGSDGNVTLYPWELWGEVLFTRHRDIDAPVVLLASPIDESTPELSISPKLDMHTNVDLSSIKEGKLSAGYTEDVQASMVFAYSILKRYWETIEGNREQDSNTIPLDLFYILNSETISLLSEKIS